MDLPAKYMESIVPAQGVLLLHGWRVHTVFYEGRLLLQGQREELNERPILGWKLELDCAEGLTDDARLGMDYNDGFIILDGFEDLIRFAMMNPQQLAEFWGANIPRIKDTEWNRRGEICPNPICGGICRKGYHYAREGIRACIPHGCTHYQTEEK